MKSLAPKTRGRLVDCQRADRAFHNYEAGMGPEFRGWVLGVDAKTHFLGLRVWGEYSLAFGSRVVPGRDPNQK